ncbi:hypothetical protein VB735_23495 [Halotia wernerae UHCC 0503]|nr:hypothetical protein [Halotia wernerae UHCC 0503]
MGGIFSFKFGHFDFDNTVLLRAVNLRFGSDHLHGQLYRFFVKLRQTLLNSYLGVLGVLGGSFLISYTKPEIIGRIFIQNWYYTKT